MCIAIVQLPGHSIEPANLWNGWRINSDGGGVAYIDNNGKVAINTGHVTYNEFERVYRDVTETYGKNGPMLVHMRIRSAGGLGPKNCHPFRIKGGAMIHNGTMFHPDDDPTSTQKDRKSDTRVFAESLHNILDLESVKKAEAGILEAVGNYNKLAFLYDGGDYHIMNENGWGCKWVDGIWYSNGGCDVDRNHSGK